MAYLGPTSVVSTDAERWIRRPRGVHQRPPWTLFGAQLVEQADGMLASVAGEVALVAVDHGQLAPDVRRLPVERPIVPLVQTLRRLELKKTLEHLLKMGRRSTNHPHHDPARTQCVRGAPCALHGTPKPSSAIPFSCVS